MRSPAWFGGGNEKIFIVQLRWPFPGTLMFDSGHFGLSGMAGLWHAYCCQVPQEVSGNQARLKAPALSKEFF
jgi:hypothetical protein